MTCLRAARAQGVLKALEEELWDGLVPLSLMRQALVHKHDQVMNHSGAPKTFPFENVVTFSLTVLCLCDL